jgi:CheY-like chemotaxis protein
MSYRRCHTIDDPPFPASAFFHFILCDRPRAEDRAYFGRVADHMGEDLMNVRKSFHVLIVEDSEADAELTRLAFEKLRLPVELYRVADGVQCLEYLRRDGAQAHASRPDLVLLDINMPRMNGFDVLGHMQADASLRRIKVVVLTSSGAEQDRLRMERLRCEAYLVKPVEFRHFVQMIDSLMRTLYPVAAHPAPHPDVSPLP